MFLKKILGKLLALAIISLLLSACGKSKSDSNSVQVEIMLPSGGNFQEFLNNEIVPAFKKKHPNIKILVSNDDKTILATRLAAGDPPDVYAGTFGYMPMKFAQMGRLVDYMKYKDYPELAKRIDPRFRGDLLDGVYYVPWNVTTQLMVYNKDLFKEAGLNPDRPPETLDEFLDYAKKITALPNRKNGSKVYGTLFWNDALSWGGWYWTMLAPMYYTINGGKYELLNPQGTKIVFNLPNAKMAEYLKFMQSAQKYAPLDFKKSFPSGTIGMWLQFGYGWVPTLKEASGKPMIIGDNIGLAPLPVPKKGDASYSTLDGRALMLFRSNPHKEDAAWELVKFLMEEENNLKACKVLGQLPSLTTLENDPFFQSPEAQPFIKQLDHVLPNENAAVSDQVQNLVLQMYMQTVVLNKKPIDKAIAETAKKAMEILVTDQE
ncbi:MAG: extracellular solute-binding protein [Lentisphaerota bacterium]